MTTTRVPCPTTVSANERRRSILLQSLDAEWANLHTSRRALRTARSWARQLPPQHPLATALADLDDLDELLAATQRNSAARRIDDEILLALVHIARTDDLAGRVVLQHLLPALIATSRRYRSFRIATDPIELVVPQAWIAIRSYDADRRRHHVASSLLSDALFQAFRKPLRRRAVTAEELREPAVFVARPHFDDPSTPLDELVTVLRESRRAGVPAHDLDLLRHLVRAGSPTVVARERNVTTRTIRNHRDRAVGRVRVAVAA